MSKDLDVTLGPPRELAAKRILEPGPARTAAIDRLTQDLRRLTGTCTDQARPQAIRLLDRALHAAQETQRP